MFDTDDDDEPAGLPDRPFRWSALVGISATFVSNVARCWAALGDDIANVALRHDNYHSNRDMAFERMHAEIEALPVTD